MKKIVLFVLPVAFAIIISSCGGKKSSSADTLKDSLTNSLNEIQKTIQDPPATDNAATTTKEDYSSLKGKDALDKYKSMLEEYQSVLKSGNTDEAAKLKSQLDDLKSAVSSNLTGNEVKAMAELTKLAIKLESNKDIDLSNSLKAYEKAVDALQNMSSEDIKQGAEDLKNTIKDAGGAVKELNDLNKLMDN